jgi:CBS domain-containing protein
MKTVEQLLHEKGRHIWSIGPNASVYDAIALMAEHGIGALPVMDDSHMVGLISERDYARQVVLQGRSSRETPVHEVMTKRVVCTQPDQTLEQAMALMTEKRVRHLPVIEESRVIGLISIGDLVKSIISEQQFIIEQLEHYITSG